MWSLDAQANQAPTLAGLLDITPRGFTGHEHVDHADIIHMNGRIYDPSLGRFLQADPFIQHPDNPQNYNRYSYIMNNPLAVTDPSGYFIRALKGLFKSVNKGLGDLAPIVAIAIGIFAAPWVAQSIWHAAAVGFTTGGIASGSLKGALIGAFSAMAFQQIGRNFRQLTSDNLAKVDLGMLDKGDLINFGSNNFLTSGQVASQVASHAAVGGIASVLGGGKFGHGFLSAGFSKFAMGNTGFNFADQSGGAVAGRTVIAALIGGSTSVLSGGKFGNGAVTAAMAHLLNTEAEHFKRGKLAHKLLQQYLKQQDPGQWDDEVLNN